MEAGKVLHRHEHFQAMRIDHAGDQDVQAGDVDGMALAAVEALEGAGAVVVVEE